MLQHIGTIWRRILRGERAGADALNGTQEDRRAFDRYPAKAEINLHLANSSDPTRYKAKLRNISRGGINVLVGREFDPGQLLSVELPAADKQSTFTVLVCIIHVAPAGEKEWSIGGTFARELSDEDLVAFGARKQRAARADKRSWQRFPCTLKATYNVVTAPQEATYEAMVLNISASGVGLAVDQCIEAGTLLSVDLMNSTGTVVRTILACVVHAAPFQKEGHWALGCNFIRQLHEEDLQALI
jgi:c-di-GMP-binding flagellar brake protein YcgR